MSTEFDQIVKILRRQDKDLMDIQAMVSQNRTVLNQIIHMIGPPTTGEEPISIFDQPTDKPLFEDSDPIDYGEGQVFEGDTDPNKRQPFFNLENEKPRLSLPFKTKDGGEAFVNWNALDPDMQQVIEIARRKDDPWQLYESPSGQMRIGISSEVEAEFRSWKMGNQIGK